jgi:hypothetical protein
VRESTRSDASSVVDRTLLEKASQNIYRSNYTMFYYRYSIMLTLTALLVIMLPWRTILEARAASQQSKAALPAATCPIAALSTWTPQETWVWSQVCRGKEADFNTALDYGDKLSPKELKGWQSKRVLRSVFLEAILLYEPFRSVLPRQGVHIIGAWFQEPLDLAYATLVHRLAIEGSRFEADVDLTAVRTSDIVDLSGSTVLGTLHMPGLHTSSVLFIGKEATFTTIDVQVCFRNLRSLLEFESALFTVKPKKI